MSDSLSASTDDRRLTRVRLVIRYPDQALKHRFWCGPDLRTIAELVFSRDLMSAAEADLFEATSNWRHNACLIVRYRDGRSEAICRRNPGDRKVITLRRRHQRGVPERLFLTRSHPGDPDDVVSRDASWLAETAGLMFPGPPQPETVSGHVPAVSPEVIRVKTDGYKEAVRLTTPSGAAAVPIARGLQFCEIELRDPSIA